MVGIRQGGFPYPIVHDDWDLLLSEYLDGPPFVRASPVTEVVRSITRSPARTELRYTTSMWTLLVSPEPGTPAPVDAVHIRETEDRDGTIVIEHLPLVGIADRIERPAADAVPVFWRFMKEKYGIEGREES